MKDKAYGKINISLDVVGIREDGYHLLDMIMVPINIYDEIEVDYSDNDIFVSNTDLLWDNSNTLYKALNLFRDKFNISDSFSIKLTKNIPSQAGLAGGSADAACLLRMLNRLCNKDDSVDNLVDIAIKIGTDVVYCLYQTCCRVKGIGEIIEPFKLDKDYQCVLIKPAKGIDTKSCYQNLDMDKCEHGSIDTVLDNFINQKDDLGLFNSLESVSFKLVNQIETIKNKCLENGFINALMSGSGSTVFVLTSNPNKAVDLFKNDGYYLLTTTIKNN